MLFLEPFFLFVFLPLTIFAFYLAGSYFNKAAALAVVLISSIVFYLPNGKLSCALLAFSITANFSLGVSILRSGNETARKTLLILGLVLNFALLATFKYFDQVSLLLNLSAVPVLGLAIPAGISFYTFHQAVFILHTYNRNNEVIAFFPEIETVRGKATAFLYYSTFVGFFPQLVIGPITFVSEFGPSVLRKGFGCFRRIEFKVGMTLIIIGLFKKLCIADVIGNEINGIYDEELLAGIPIGRARALFAMTGYFFQLYFDFSGYSDIGLGIARLLGIRLPINFDSPLRATGIVDFYRRWHMTLTRVLVFFVFTPLSLWGSRYALTREYKGWRRRAFGTWLPLLINFQLIALWHAAKETFILFGLIHGVWYILETETRSSKGFKYFRSHTSDRLRSLAGMALTAFPLMLTFALFRSDTLSSFGTLLESLVGFGHKASDADYVNRRLWMMLSLVAFVVYCLPNANEWLARYRIGYATFVNPSMTPSIFRFAWRPNLICAVVLGALFIACFTRLNIPIPFLYAGF